MTPGELEKLVEAVVRRELQKIFAPLAEPTPTEEWVDVNEACETLGFPDNEALYRAIRSGLFRKGTEVRDRRLPGRKKPRYQFHVARCQSRLSQSPEKRKVVSEVLTNLKNLE